MEIRTILDVTACRSRFHHDCKSGALRRQFGGIQLVSKQTKASTTLPGKVEKVIRPHPGSGEPEKAQIGVEGADHLYREIRIPNDLTDENGHKVKLEEGAEVEVKVEADQSSTNGSHGEKKAASPQP